MPLYPLFAERISIFSDPTKDIHEKIEIFNAPLSEYVSPPVETEDITIPSEAVAIPARIYKPAGATSELPGLVWFHGGGFTEGGLWQNESHVVALEIAHRTPAVVMAVDYRLCNDGVVFPAPQEDGLEALKYFAAHAKTLGVDTERIFIGGISAGGALAASVAVLDRDLNLNTLAGQLLNCPILHLALPEYSEELQSKLDESSGFGLNREFVDTRNTYLCGGDISNAEPWWFAGEIDDHEGLAPTQLINCEYDALRASGERYGEQLKAADVEVEVLYEPGTVHAHINRYPQDCKPMDLTLNRMVDFIQRH